MVLILALLACARRCDDQCHFDAALATSRTDWPAMLAHVDAVSSDDARSGTVLAVAQQPALVVAAADAEALCARAPHVVAQDMCRERFGRTHLKGR